MLAFGPDSYTSLTVFGFRFNVSPRHWHTTTTVNCVYIFDWRRSLRSVVRWYEKLTPLRSRFVHIVACTARPICSSLFSSLFLLLIFFPFVSLLSMLCRNPHIRWWDFCDCIFIWHKQQRSSVEIYWCTNESTWRWMNRESFFSVLRSSLTFFVFTFSVNVVQPLLSLSWWRTDSLSAVFFLPLFVELMFDDCFFCDVVHFVEMKKYIHFSVRHAKLMDKVGQSIHLRISVVKWSTDNALFFLYRKITAKKRDSVVNRQFSRFKWTTKRREQIEFKSVFMSQFWKLKLHQLLLLLFWIRNHIEIKRETEEFHCKT